MKYALLCLLLLATPARAVQPDEILGDAKLEARARTLSEGFRCLVCQNQSIDESEASLARDLRILIRERLTKGDDDQQIKDFVVARYGDYVLLKPRLNARTAALWATPFLIILAGLGFFAARRRKPNSPQEAPLSEAEKAALSKVTGQRAQ
jgi:cytochrome c-type biogenesis protein CcmH